MHHSSLGCSNCTLERLARGAAAAGVVEARAAAALNHPNVCTVHEVSQAEGHAFIVMEYVEGQPITDYCETRKLSIRERLELFRTICSAVHYAHKNLVVHRDIKPGNVLLSGKHAFVTDFGVAKAVEASTGTSTLMTAGIALGTPAYMAPEQAAGDPSTDHRADIYALGTVGYEMLTGRTPFTDKSPQAMLAAHLSAPPEPLSTYRDGVPTSLAHVVMRCLAKNPSHRFQTMEELKQALQQVVHVSGGGHASIAVLPFLNLSDDPKQEYFTDGVSEDILTELSRFRELLVIARNSSFSFRGQSVDVREIGRTLATTFDAGVYLPAAIASLIAPTYAVVSFTGSGQPFVVQ